MQKSSICPHGDSCGGFGGDCTFGDFLALNCFQIIPANERSKQLFEKTAFPVKMIEGYCKICGFEGLVYEVRPNMYMCRKDWVDTVLPRRIIQLGKAW